MADGGRRPSRRAKPGLSRRGSRGSRGAGCQDPLSQDRGRSAAAALASGRAGGDREAVEVPRRRAVAGRVGGVESRSRRRRPGATVERAGGARGGGGVDGAGGDPRAARAVAEGAARAQVAAAWIGRRRRHRSGSAGLRAARSQWRRRWSRRRRRRQRRPGRGWELYPPWRRLERSEEGSEMREQRVGGEEGGRGVCAWVCCVLGWCVLAEGVRVRVVR